MTKEMVWEILRASASILIPELERHLALQEELPSSIWRLPQLDDTRSTCDTCRMSFLCCARLCKFCGYEVCDRCTREGQVARTSCSGQRSVHGHEFALLEVFQPGELKWALDILHQIPPPHSPPPAHSADLIRIQLSDTAEAPDYATLYNTLASGVPLIISGIDPGVRNLTPEYFMQRHGNNEVTVVNTKTGATRTVLLSEFMATFRKSGDNPDNPQKLKDWPPTANFPDEFPDMFEIYEDCLPGLWVTARKGPLNLEASMPSGSNSPDLGPKGYFAHGLTRTDLHGDITDAVNILFHAAPRDDGTEGGALWIMIHRDDMALAERLLRKLKAGCFEGHPIHAQVVHLTVEDVDDLRRQKVRIWTFIQRQGDAVFIPAGVGHQVTNLSSCIKIAVDFVSPCNVAHSRMVSEQLRQHRLDCGDTDSEDVLQLTSICWWAFKRSQTDDLLLLRSKPDSNPWISKHSAAPRASAYTTSSIHEDFISGEVAAEELVVEDFLVETTSASAGLGVSSPSPSRSQPSSSSLTVPSKRRVSDHDDVDTTRTQMHRRHVRALRDAIAREDSKKTLSCPIGASGRACNRTGYLFPRQGLLNHLEDTHRELVIFRHKGHSNKKLVKVRREILAQHKDDDTAFVGYIEQYVLGNAPVTL